MGPVDNELVTECQVNAGGLDVERIPGLHDPPVFAVVDLIVEEPQVPV